MLIVNNVSTFEPLDKDQGFHPEDTCCVDRPLCSPVATSTKPSSLSCKCSTVHCTICSRKWPLCAFLTAIAQIYTQRCSVVALWKCCTKVSWGRQCINCVQYLYFLLLQHSRHLCCRWNLGHHRVATTVQLARRGTCGCILFLWRPAGFCRCPMQMCGNDMRLLFSHSFVI